MNRRWQKDASGLYDGLESYAQFVAKLPQLTKPLGIAGVADVYSTYSVLHSKRRNPELRTNHLHGFYYLMADAQQPGTTTQPDVATDPISNSSSSTIRQEPVVPVGSKYQGLTMEQLQRLFEFEPGQPPVPHILLAIADSDGSVSLMRVFNYIQPPFEGPETLPPVALGPGDDDSDIDQ